MKTINKEKGKHVSGGCNCMCDGAARAGKGPVSLGEKPTKDDCQVACRIFSMGMFSCH